MKNNSIKTVVATGIGAALFVVIGLVIDIPTFVLNTSIQLQYAVQALLSILLVLLLDSLLVLLVMLLKTLFSMVHGGLGF